MHRHSIRAFRLPSASAWWPGFALLAAAVLPCAPVAAQSAPDASRTWVEVTPLGVFTHTESTPAGTNGVTATAAMQAGGAALAPNPNPSPEGLRWVYANPAATPWITQSVSTGDRGSLAWLGQNLNGQRLSLLATTENGVPPVPVYEDLLTGANFVQVAGADKARGAAVVNGQPGTNEVRFYRDDSVTPKFSLFPTVSSGFPAAARISADGTRLAVGYLAPSGLGTVDVWDTTVAGGALIRTLTVPTGGFRHHEISPDGTVVLIGTDNHDWLYNVDTGALLFDDGTTVSQDAHSLNKNGTTWGRGGFDVGAWVATGGVYTRVLTFTDSTLGFGVYYCGLSADGKTFAVAAYDATNANKFRIYCFALTPTSSTLLWKYSKTGTGTLQDVPSAVSVSDDGKYIAVGSWGSASNSHPEILLFDRDVGNVPIGSVDTPGSCFDLDLSGDGQFIVAGTKSVHANSFGNGGEGYSFDRGGQGFWLSGTMSLPGSSTLHVGGNPGDNVILTASLGLLTTPLSNVAGFTGLYYLDPTPGILIIPQLPVGSVPAGGTLSLPVTLGPNPAAIGLDIYMQAARVGPGTKVLENLLTIPLLP